ncbi:MAG: MFS transporter [Armatimonadota bacterium]|nr:MFS transporter [Armatimonadota bacterium]MCX7777741.1 MFS transporter [Armatimonadota bacterium]MDW8026204.1 MFS transporter [Armatimonadota bacterium]
MRVCKGMLSVARKKLAVWCKRNSGLKRKSEGEIASGSVSPDGGESERSLAEELVTAFKLAFSQPRLSLMMFIQYAVWGAWFPALSGYLEKHFGFSGEQIGWIYSTLPLANLVVPFTAGQVADRWLPAQVALSLFYLFGGLVMLAMAFQSNFPVLLVLMLVCALLYAPTLALTNTIALRNLKDPQREFGPIRVWGTIGWIAAGLLLTALRKFAGSEGWRLSPEVRVIDVYILGSVLSFIMCIASLTLPHTPPAKEAPDPLAFRRAFVLLRNRAYLIFFIIAFIVATELQLYYILTFPFLSQWEGKVAGITTENLPAYMTIAQIAEIFVMTFMLPYGLPRWGVRNSLLIGLIAWPVRYFIFSLVWSLYATAPNFVWLAIAALTLHGFCYVFFFVVAFIYTDMVTPPDIRASAQSLINVAVLGVGLLIGSWFAGWLKDICTPESGLTNYTIVFLVPGVITLICAFVFAALFREER